MGPASPRREKARTAVRPARPTTAPMTGPARVGMMMFHAMVDPPSPHHGGVEGDLDEVEDGDDGEDADGVDEDGLRPEGGEKAGEESPAAEGGAGRRWDR